MEPDTLRLIEHISKNTESLLDAKLDPLKESMDKIMTDNDRRFKDHDEKIAVIAGRQNKAFAIWSAIAALVGLTGSTIWAFLKKKLVGRSKYHPVRDTVLCRTFDRSHNH